VGGWKFFYKNVVVKAGDGCGNPGGTQLGGHDIPRKQRSHALGVAATKKDSPQRRRGHSAAFGRNQR